MIIIINCNYQKGVINNDRPHGLPLTATLLPEVLKKFGYSTHAVGKSVRLQ